VINLDQDGAPLLDEPLSMPERIVDPACRVVREAVRT
jgi:hypothetical protein